MTEQETAKLLVLLKLSYPYFYSKFSEEDVRYALLTWYNFLKDLSWDVVKKIVKDWVRFSNFPPTISQIIQEHEEYKQRSLKQQKKLNFDSLRLVKEKEEKDEIFLKEKYAKLNSKDKEAIEEMIKRKKMENKYNHLFPDLIKTNCIEIFFKHKEKA